MKPTSLVSTLLIVAFCITPVLSLSLSTDFITGFESGIFLRSNDNLLDEYQCPEAKPAGAMGNVKEMLQPIKMMTSMIQDKNIVNMVSTMELFISSLSSLMAVFTNYEGGDFCSGLIFGSNGAVMLTNIAKTLFEISTGKNPLNPQ